MWLRIALVYYFHLRSWKEKVMRRVYALMIYLLSALAAAQAQPDSTVTTAPGPGCINIRYSNDMFTHTDRYYTNGFRIDIASPGVAHMFTRHFLPALRNSSHTYGIAIVQDIFTPSTLKSDFIVPGDRPYAAYAYAGSFLVSANPVKKVSLTAELDAGVIGPGAMGYEVQSGVHHLINNRHPEGWSRQVKNDIVLSYSLDLEKELLSVGKVFDLSATAGLDAGTLYDNASAGMLLRMGKMTSRFETVHGARDRWQLYLFMDGKVTGVAYNATLQGGMFSKDDPYVLGINDMKRVLYSPAAGVAIGWRKIELEYSYRYLSPELRAGMAHRWGNCRIRIAL